MNARRTSRPCRLPRKPPRPKASAAPTFAQDCLMHSLDLNLLQALDVLLEEGSVVAAAARVHLSPPAMSRTLSRIREMVGDPVLVRAGSRLVPTPRAEELRPQVRALLEEARRMLVPTATDFTQLSRVFTLRATDAIAAT